MTNKVDQAVIDKFMRSSVLFERLTFDDTISPATGGSTLGYSYIQLKTPSTVAVREINSEYTPGHAKREEKNTKAVILGGSFEIDRVIAQTSGAVDEVDFQMNQKIEAGKNYFHELVINGTSAQSGTGYIVKTFDGLKKLLSGQETEFTATADISTPELLDTNYNAFLDEVDSFVSSLQGKPDLLMMNHTMFTKLKACARRAGFYDRSTNGFGRTVETYNGIEMVDMGKYFNGTSTEDVIKTETDGTTAIYAVVFGLDAFHGISIDGSKMLHTYVPDFKTPGAVKKGEVELIAGVALKNSNKAGVLKGIKIKATAQPQG